MADQKPPPTPQLPEIEGTPLPDELTGRASKTNDDLTTLFDNGTEEHIADGFRGGSGEEEPAGS
jgi:hypothetical protein